MQEENGSLSRRRRITGSVLIILVGLMLIGSAGAKFARLPKVVNELSAAGFDWNKLLFVAALEVLSAVFLLIPFTRSAGLLLASSFLGGAIATHLQHGQPIIQPSFVLCLLWLGAWLRHPTVLWSFRFSTQETSRIRIGQ
jgi:hypothetical protein